ncbi:MAG TPA: carbonic anhydrase family protein [Alphaproteobacteria bacterium]|nr:carbonic anhydrase family protein [Alphaproteobacteria bacterium]USO05978.1 MAG: carbonic anhydrase family protein [Rhodospirillales bacterium]HOO81179.1 carbonic anhydrase family protein [Alphaproteobacteria bacterium]
MKKFLLSTVFSFVFVMPGWAEEAVVPVDAVQGKVQPVIEETADGVVKVVQEAVVPAYAQEAGTDVQVVKAESSAGDRMSADEGHGDMDAETVAVEHHGTAQAHWGYSGGEAAPYWGTLDGSYELCASGQEQSPVNIAKFLQEDVPDITLSYKPSSLNVVNNGHTIQVNYDAGSGFEAAGVNYNLLQLHFHTPSEHYLDGAPYPMEMHLVHKAADGTLGVIGVMMKIGGHNPVIEGVWQNAPIQAGGSKSIESVEINAADLMPASLEYYKYDGSLTTPPCSEGVRWHVLKEPIEISEMQLKAFQALFPVNARPVQSLNDRVITGD